MEPKLYVDLSKSRSRGHLVPVKKQVTRNGKSIETTVYVNPKKGKGEPSRKKANEKVFDVGDKVRYTRGGKEKVGQVTDVSKTSYVVRTGRGTEIIPKKAVIEESKKKEQTRKRPSIVVAVGEPVSGNKNTDSINIKDTLKPIRKTLGRERYKEFLRANGVVWEPNTDHPGADTLRASQAAKRWLEEGNQLNMDIMNDLTSSDKTNVTDPTNNPEPAQVSYTEGMNVYYTEDGKVLAGTLSAIDGDMLKVIDARNGRETEITKESVIETMEPGNHERLELRREALETIERVEAEIRDMENETAHLVSQSGEVLMTQQGDKTSVNMVDAVRQGILRGAILTHNHPSGLYSPIGESSFSSQDIAMLLRHNLKEIRAVGAKWVHRARVPEKYKDMDMYNGEYIKFMGEVDDSIGFIDPIIRASLHTDIRNGKVTSQEASVIHWHRVWEHVSKETGLIYVREERK